MSRWLPDRDDVLLVLGALLLVGGVALIYPPASMVLAGIICIAFPLRRRSPNGRADQ